MRRIISCQFNIDTACVDVEYEDGFVPVSSTPFDVEEKQDKENKEKRG